MTARDFIALNIGMILIIFVYVIFMPYNNEDVIEDNFVQMPYELTAIEWCETCYNQKQIYFNYCKDQILSGNIDVPSGISITEYCEIMAQYQVDICLKALCKD